jgi:hypothetical protein
MKRFLLLCSTVFVLFVIASSYSSAQLQVGGGLALGSEGTTFGLEGRLRTTFGGIRNIFICADFMWFLPDNGTQFSLDGNAHYQFVQFQRSGNPDKAGSGLYALAGLNITRFEIGQFANTDIGLNLGIGGTALLGPVDLYGDIKYVLGGFDQAVLSLGVLFTL